MHKEKEKHKTQLRYIHNKKELNWRDFPFSEWEDAKLLRYQYFLNLI